MASRRVLGSIVVVALLVAACGPRLATSPPTGSLPAATTDGPDPSASGWALVRPDVVASASPGTSSSCAECHGEVQSTMSGVAVGPAGLVAVGWVIEGFRGIAWHSSDGSTWAADKPLGEKTPLLAIAANSTAYVAAGVDGGAAAVWTSTNGATWRQGEPASAFEPGPGRVTSVVSWAGGFAAAGYEGTNVGPAVPAFWTSSDGSHWQRATVAAGAHGRVWSLAASGSVLVAVGSIGPEETPEAGIVWTSADGLRWTQEPSSPAFDKAVIRSVAAIPGVGLVAAGADGNDSGAIWRSADGRSWTRSARAGAGGLGTSGSQIRINAVVPGGSGMLAVGRAAQGPDAQYGSAAVWTSSDGVVWHQSRDSVEFIAAELFGATAWHGRVVAVGYSLAPDDDAATSWLSPATGLGW